MEEPNDADMYDAQDEETYPIYGRSTERKLDEIEVASDLVISVLQTMATILGLVWAIEVTTALNDSSGSALKALWAWDGTYDDVPSPSEAVWLKHVLQLVSWGVLRAVLKTAPHVGRIYYRYFEIPKAGNVNRTIFDGSAAKVHWGTPGRMGLPTMAAIIEVLSMLPHATYVCADIRNWFHVIPLPEGVKHLFSCTVKDDPERRVFELNTTPMGTPHAPRHAQICGWVLVLSSAPKDLHPDLSGCQESPPPFVWFLNKKGERAAVAFLWLDNVTIACRYAVHARSFAHNLKQMQKGSDEKTSCGITWKELACTEVCDFLGLRIWWQGKSRESTMMWQHKLTNIDRWKLLVGTRPFRTVRDLQMRLGVITWDTCARVHPFAMVRDALDCSPLTTERAESTPHGLTATQMDVIQRRLELVCENKIAWRQVFQLPKTSIFAFSDATLERVGFFLTDGGGNVVGVASSGMATGGDIYEEESEQAMLAIEAGWLLYDHVILGCDNLNTVYAFQRKNGRRETVCCRILRLEAKRTQGKTFTIAYVPTDENPADGLTRFNKAERWKGKDYKGVGYAVETHKILSAIDIVKAYAPPTKTRGR